MTHRSRTRVGATLATALMAASASIVVAFVFTGATWPDGPIIMQLQLGQASGRLLNGQTSWNQAVTPALVAWNSNIARVQFSAVQDSTSAIASPNGLNNVIWGNTVFGQPFSDEVIAVTYAWRVGTRSTEGDVVFNLAYPWNAYLGPLQRAASGNTLLDISRVALHEFGHVLGLTHPDQAGQNVAAIMNSRTGNLDQLTADDIAGARALYGAAAAPGALILPPRNESIDFRNQLEALYRDRLRRQPSSSFTDIEGIAVWFVEYLWYRVNLCDQTQAQARVFAQIEGRGVQPLCGSPASIGLFPSSQDARAFRDALDREYRDVLLRQAGSTFVDAEGDSVWISEYARLRMTGSSHQQAVTSVITRIETITGLR